MTLSAGDQLGPYEILAAIGAGGMGEVYKARDTRLDRTVAIKVLPDHIAKREDLRARFEREARAVASLNHPNICVLHDIGRHEGAGYMVMEFMEGETLSARIAKGALPLEQALKYATQIADALDRAHRAGVVHRDVKPPNIMLTRDGVKVLDFGLAKSAASSTLAPGEATLTAALTTEGKVMGPPQYMAPEQFEGKEADARCDIWAFGAVLYEMVTGQKAFQGKTYVSLVGAILSADPPPLAVAPFTPSWLERLVRRCLAKDPEDRYQSMRDVVIDLRTPPPPQETVLATVAPGRPKLPWILAGAAAVSLGALAFVHFRESTPPRPPLLRWEIASDTLAQFHAISPDGRQLASVRDDNGVRRLFLRSLDSLETKPVPDTSGAVYPFWSPDSRHLGFFADGKLKRIDPGGARAQVICDAPNPRGGSWNREDVIVFAPDINGPLHRVSAAGGNPAAVTKVEAGASHRYPSFIDGGRKFLFLAEGAAGTMVGDLEGPAAVSVVPNSGSNTVYVPAAMEAKTGWLLFRRDEAVLAQAFDPKKLLVSGEPIVVVDQVSQSGHFGNGAFSSSLNGILAYRKGARVAEKQLVWLSRTGERLSTVGAPGPILDLSLSPDGKRIAFALRASEAVSNVWMLDIETGVPSRFAAGRVPVWSRDGADLLYAEPDRTSFDTPFYRKPSYGGKEAMLGRFGSNASPTDFSPDGKYLAYSSTGDKSNEDIWLLPLSGDGRPISFLKTAASESRPKFSPGGNWLAYESDESGRSEIWVQPLPPNGSRFQISAAGGTQARWRRDGKEMYYVSLSGRLMAVPVSAGKSFEHGAPRELFGGMPSTGVRQSHYQVSADGQRFLVALPVGKEGAVAPLTVVVNWLAELKK